MFFFLFSYSVSLPSNCFPGTVYYPGNGASTIIETALTPTQVYQDLHMIGSFCPPVTGQYRLIYEGTTNGANDATWSTYYWIQGPAVKTRTSSWFLLNDTSCYIYQSHVATVSIQAYGSIYYEKSGETKKLITKDVSYTCSVDFCKNNGIFPNCKANIPLPERSLEETLRMTKERTIYETMRAAAKETVARSYDFECEMRILSSDIFIRKSEINIFQIVVSFLIV